MRKPARFDGSDAARASSRALGRGVLGAMLAYAVTGLDITARDSAATHDNVTDPAPLGAFRSNCRAGQSAQSPKRTRMSSITAFGADSTTTVEPDGRTIIFSTGPSPRPRPLLPRR